MKKVYTIATAIVFLFLLITVSACKRNGTNIEQLIEGDCFLTNINNKELVVRLDVVRSNTVSGSYFYTNTLLAEPHPFTVEVKKKNSILKMDALGDSVKIKWQVQQDAITVNCNSKELPHEIILKRCSPKDNKLFHRQLCDSLYCVKVDTNVEYARAFGYWTSEPDTNESMAKILSDLYTRHLDDLINVQEQSLLMDIYEPIDNDTSIRRPLILLIHGGAFLNGDKQDEPYVKWSQHFASLGYVAVSINYRMGILPGQKNIDRAGYRAAQDANAALRYMLHHADTYRINPDWVFTWGTSAGAITALNVAFLNDLNRPESVKDEGPISKLASECPETFHVRAVANMWGAVHDTAILASSHTAVISFHNEGDNIVPYKKGHPFMEMFKDIIIPSRWNKANNVGTMGKKVSLQDKIISPMYGSACIDEYLKNHHVRSELHKVSKGKIHSLHVDKNRKIVPYFYTIQDSVAQFFYTEIIQQPVNLRQDNPQSLFFRINDANVAEVHWQVDGGVLLESSDSRAKVVFFKDAKRRVIRVCGKYKNGIEFSEKMVL